jgi:isopenicillin N synthase-like dioxygenase
MLASLSRNGYFRLKFDAELMECVNNAFDATEAFFAASQEEKNAFQGTTTGRLAPFFGYRHVPSMKKEFFVFRNTELLPVPNLLAPLRPTFFRFGELLLECMKAMIPCELGDCFGSVKTMAELKHSTFLEVFKYDGIPLNGALGEQKVRITSQEHRDTSLLTLIPQARGAAGLEAYDWSAYQWRSLEGPGHESEAVVFAGELVCSLFCLFACLMFLQSFVQCFEDLTCRP